MLDLGLEVHDLGYKFESIQPKDDSAKVWLSCQVVSEEGHLNKKVYDIEDIKLTWSLAQ